MIEINNVSKTYGKKRSLANVTLTVESGEVIGLLGPNGAGKSTLLSILSTITAPSSGNVTIGGLSLKKNQKAIREVIGYVPQDIALWEELSVKENMKMWSKMTSRSLSNEQLQSLCSAVQLEGRWKEKVKNLSGGMKRKLNIAVSLIHEPSVLLMDEPTVGIDLQSKLEIIRYIKQLAAKGKTIIYITHDLNEILGVCDRFAVLKEGKLEFVGTMDQAKEKTREDAEENVVYKLLHD
ncbi:ABC transporter ATP-binding protein [Priestia aryabhattai]|uniref:ABC transporter ATP-binding protein n=1 Tax=Priestia aryabhattai TaxID=412384 RepID=UPI001C8D1B5B|nr:ABC transporter ATP-binding protein [Priestia aryabhattai]MBY0006687.1 ABC transporter ATP-binding protein [Priestia aryabhattai]MBY0047351.1 ABC transporter ATP-binding protein [Priestia aryabhattai]